MDRAGWEALLRPWGGYVHGHKHLVPVAPSPQTLVSCKHPTLQEASLETGRLTELVS